MVIDSSGLKVYGEGEWKTRQHGVSKRRTWRKMHLSVDAVSGEVQAAMLSQRPPFLCQQCHGAQGHPSVPGLPSGLPGSGTPSGYLLASGCANCHSQVHGSNHPSGTWLTR